MAKPAQKPAQGASVVKARVLLDGPFGAANSVVEVTPEQLESSADALDASPEAVAYAESLNV